jgi:hypothetical protein
MCRLYFTYVILFFDGTGFESGIPVWKAGAGKAVSLLFKPHLQSILLWLFWKWILTNCLPELLLNPELNHSSS